MTISLQNFDQNQVSTIDHFLSSSEVDHLCSLLSEKKWNRSQSSGGGHGRTGREEGRKNDYIILTESDPQTKVLVGTWWKRLQPLLPQDLNFCHSPYFGSAGGAEWTPVGLSDRLRFYRYGKGDVYPEHMDGSYKRTVTDKNGDTFIEQTFFTFLIYLNGEGEFEGGETVFDKDTHCRFLNGRVPKDSYLSISPQKGRALLNLHSIIHQGSTVMSGTKYVVKTDIIYRKRVEKHPKLKTGANQGPSTSPWEKLFEPSCKNYHD